MNKFWEFRNVSEDEAELLLYGEIASERPWWDWEGETLTHKQFIEDLKALGQKSNITVRINSIGGDVFAAHAIYTQLKTNSANITVIVDGLAASAATIVAMAGDTVKMPTNAMLMVHNPSVVLWGSYDSAELDKMSNTLGQIKESIISAYVAKTQMGRKELSKLMDKESWLTAQEAKEYGLVDEVMFEDVQAVINGKLLIVNNIRHDLSKFKNKPVIPLMQSVSQPPAPEPHKAVNNIPIKQEGEDISMSFKNIDELKNAYPELVKQIEDAAREDGRKGERARIQDIEKISKNLDPTLVNKAKFEEPMNAQELAFQALQADGAKAQQYLNNVKAEIIESGVEDVAAAPSTDITKEEKPKTVVDKFKNIAANLDAKRRGVSQ